MLLSLVEETGSSGCGLGTRWVWPGYEARSGGCGLGTVGVAWVRG